MGQITKIWRWQNGVNAIADYAVMYAFFFNSVYCTQIERFFFNPSWPNDASMSCIKMPSLVDNTLSPSGFFCDNYLGFINCVVATIITQIDRYRDMLRRAYDDIATYSPSIDSTYLCHKCTCRVLEFGKTLSYPNAHTYDINNGLWVNHEVCMWYRRYWFSIHSFRWPGRRDEKTIEGLCNKSKTNSMVHMAIITTVNTCIYILSKWWT